MTLKPRKRQILVVVACVNMIVALSVYCAATFVVFDNGLVDFLLLASTVAVFLPVRFTEPDMARWNYLWKGYRQGRPNWVLPSYIVLFVLTMAHFFITTPSQDGGVPEVLAGQYVLVAHGAILRVLTHGEYVRMAGAFTRTFMGVVLGLNYFSWTVLWFPRNPATPN